MNERQFRLWVVRPTLTAMRMWSEAAEDVLVGTAVHESGGLESLDQQTHADDATLGPAFGVFQMERATMDDLLDRYLVRRIDLHQRVSAFRAELPADPAAQLMTNLAFATALARVKYWMAPEPLPAIGDLNGYAAYWKRHWNTELGAGTTEKFIRDWNHHGAAAGADWL